MVLVYGVGLSLSIEGYVQYCDTVLTCLSIQFFVSPNEYISLKKTFPRGDNKVPIHNHKCWMWEIVFCFFVFF